MKTSIYFILILLCSCLAKDEYVAAPAVYDLEIEYSFTSPYAFIDLVNKNVSRNFADSLWHLKFQN